MNLMKGFLIVWPITLWGAIIYATLKNGKSIPIRTISKACKTIFLRLKPGSPSYHIDANSC
jgi:hypothetical protein